MLVYKIVASLLYGLNVLLLLLKVAQAVYYKQRRVATINAIGLAVAIGMLVWTWTL